MVFGIYLLNTLEGKSDRFYFYMKYSGTFDGHFVFTY
jgi:hypothetical protein